MVQIVSLSGSRRYFTNSLKFFYKNKFYSSRLQIVRIADNILYFVKYFLVKHVASVSGNNIFENTELRSRVFKYALLDTSWYKNTRFIGFVELYSGELLFIKVFKQESAAISEFENYGHVKRSKLTESFVIPSQRRCGRIILSEVMNSSGNVNFLYLLRKCINWGDDPDIEHLNAIAKQRIANSLIRHDEQLRPIVSRFKARTVETIFSHGDFKLDNIVKTVSNESAPKDCYAVLDYECCGMYPIHFDLFTLMMERFDYDYREVSNICTMLFGSIDSVQEDLENFLIFRLYGLLAELGQFPNNRFLQDKIRLLELFVEKVK